MVVKVGFVKLGNIGCAPLIEFLLDERAEREDIEVRVIGSGSKMNAEGAEEISKKILEFDPDFVVITSPNAALPGPTKAREILAQKVPVIVVSDLPAKKIVPELEEKGIGYIIVEADAMLGARREFLDPIEMALFNADLIKVLSITGVYNILFESIDKVIEAIKRGEKPELPKIVVKGKKAVKAAGFFNPYAASKALASFEIAKNVADVTVTACFKEKDWEKYTLLCSTAHEMMTQAAKLAEEAREIEKYADKVLRKPHYDDGTILFKRALIEKPSKIN
ncbi:MAG TPA: F420-dependent methylenetetrahydromethanopterin dehydrogenase [Candidatus Korarchaeota archaeon]|nr:F420-dependent methylenetetrahydromethanopterin dehydrogenase [Candidatus Korarchaeota archaeon]